MNTVRSIIRFATVLSAILVLGVPLIIAGSYVWRAHSSSALPLSSIPHSMSGSTSDHAPEPRAALQTMPEARASAAPSDGALETGSVTPAEPAPVAAPKVDVAPVRRALQQIGKATAALKRSAPAPTGVTAVSQPQTTHGRNRTVLAPSASELALFSREW